MIRLEFTYTVEDLAEAMESRPTSRRLTIGRIAFVGFIVLLSVLVHTVPDWSGKPELAHIYDPVPHDLVLTLLPSLVPALGFILIVLAQRVHVSSSRSGWITRRGILRLLAAAIIFGTFLVLLPILPITVNLTRGGVVLIVLAPWLIAILVITILDKAMFRMAARWLWRDAPVVRRARKVEIADLYFHVQDDLVEWRCSWAHFAVAGETVNLLLLVGEDERLFILPKRAFSGAEEVATAKAIFREKLPQTQFLDDNPSSAVVATS